MGKPFVKKVKVSNSFTSIIDTIVLSKYWLFFRKADLILIFFIVLQNLYFLKSVLRGRSWSFNKAVEP